MSQQAPEDKSWSVYVRLSHCSGAENRRNAVKHAGYVLRPGECLLAVSDEGPVTDLQAAKARWKGITEVELAKRVDARLQSRLIIPLPNTADYRVFVSHFSEFFREKQLKGHAWLLSVHEGKHGAVPENLHVHALFNDRDLLTGKKNRSLQKREWLQEVKAEYEKWLHDHGHGPNVPVERVPTMERHKSHAVYSLQKREETEAAALNEELKGLNKEWRDVRWDIIVAEERFKAAKKPAARQRPEFPGRTVGTPSPTPPEPTPILRKKPLSDITQEVEEAKRKTEAAIKRRMATESAETELERLLRERCGKPDKKKKEEESPDDDWGAWNDGPGR